MGQVGERASKDQFPAGFYLGKGEGKTLSSLLLLLLLLFSPNSLGKGCGTSWGTGEAAPQGTSWCLQVKANKPVEHIEEKEGDWENHSRVVIKAVDMDEEAALLPGAALTSGDRAAVLLAPLATATRARGAAWPDGLPGWARWALLFLTLLFLTFLLLLGVLNVAHKSFRMLDDTDTGRGWVTCMGTRLKGTREEVRTRQGKVNQA